MPFSKTTDEHTKEYWHGHFTEYLKPLIEENPNVQARQSKPLRGDVVREIVKDLVLSPIVLADLTDSNPNVYWELGVRQSFKAGTITIADDGYRQKVPFNIGAKSILFYYPNDAHEDAHFRADVKSAIQDCLDNPNRPDSAVLETVSGRGTLYEIVHREESIRRLDALAQELRRNESVYEDMIQLAEENRQLRKGGKSVSFITERFRLISAELLLTHRYVDESDKFYLSAANYYNHLSACNEQMAFWRAAQEPTESWVLDSQDRKKREAYLSDFKSMIDLAREKLVAFERIP
jgi:hypothetical protein